MSDCADTLHIYGPITSELAEQLTVGTSLLYTGTLYTARDAAHERICSMLSTGEELPFELDGAIIFYAGPAPARPGQAIGPVGPTSSYRMDSYTPTLLSHGVRALIGKGARSPEVAEAIRTHRAIYFAAIGGVAALMSQCVTSSELVCFEDLGTEAVRKLEVHDLPLIVAIDAWGRNIYEEGPQAYLASQT